MVRFVTRNEENFPRSHSSQGVLFITAWSLARLKGKLVHSAENIRFKLIILLSRWRKSHGSRIVSDSFSTLSVKSSLKSSTKLNDVRALYRHSNWIRRKVPYSRNWDCHATLNVSQKKVLWYLLFYKCWR